MTQLFEEDMWVTLRVIALRDVIKLVAGKRALCLLYVTDELSLPLLSRLCYNTSDIWNAVADENEYVTTADSGLWCGYVSVTGS